MSSEKPSLASQDRVPLPPRQEPEPRRNALPHSWGTLLWGFAAVIGAAVVCGASLAQFFAARPTDITGYTTSLANSIEELLLANLVPREQLTRSPGEVQRDNEFLWQRYDFDVVAPPSVSVEDLAKAIGAAVARQGGLITADPASPRGESVLRLLCADREFAVVRLSGGAEGAQQRVASGHGTNAGAEWTEARLPPPTLPPVTLPVLEAPTCEGSGAQSPSHEELPIEWDEWYEWYEWYEWELDIPPVVPEKKSTTRPRVAIIVDDGGYGGPNTEAILRLDPRLTLAILPGAPDAATTARRAADLGFEVMLHMPMEPSRTRKGLPNCVTMDMTKEEIIERLNAAMAEVPGAVGLNNHTGSKFTSDPQAMRTFLEAVKDLSLYFVDSRTTARSVGYAVACELGVPAAARDVFLDHKPDAAHTSQEFKRLMALALERGEAIGICHFLRRSTAETLGRLLPELEAAGIELVHASELVR